MNNLSELQRVYNSLMDEESRRTFRGYWLGNISNQIGEIVYASTPHYLTEGFIPKENSVVIDGGTFTGDTASFFADMKCKVYGFEMDKNNFKLAKDISKHKNFTVENVGLGSYKHTINYISSGNTSKIDVNGNETATIITLDSYVKEKNIPRVDFIKLDVEGAELDVLKGAVVTICRFKPILALSAYHKWNDFWVIMDFIKSIRSDYEFAMRQYYSDAEDVKEVFKEGVADIFYNLGLDVNWKWYNECCLLAR